MKIPVGISNRHCHLTEETYEKLFGNKEIEKEKELKQPGEFASSSKLTIKNGEREIKGVRVLGPFRKYDQVEISKTDAFSLKLNPPVRKSGDVSESEAITLVGPCGEVTIDKGCIIANRHIHFGSEEASSLGLKNDQIVTVKVNSEKSGSMEVFVKIQDPAYLELHIDTDDANAFLLSNGDEVELII